MSVITTYLKQTTHRVPLVHQLTLSTALDHIGGEVSVTRQYIKKMMNKAASQQSAILKNGLARFGCELQLVCPALENSGHTDVYRKNREDGAESRG